MTLPLDTVAARPRITLRVTWRYCVALYCMVMLYSSLHELVHHVVGRMVCGAWGVKTFNYFATACEGSLGGWMATFAGPAFSFAVMWVGWWLLARPASRLLSRHIGFALIFAQMPAQRITGPLFGHNDEYYAAWHLFGRTPLVRWSTLAVILLCTVPPLIGAWHAIANRRRTAWFLLHFLLLPYLLWGPFFMLFEYLLVQRHVLADTMFGIPYLFAINEVATLILYVATRHWLDPDAT
ncbi:MAG: hypothetical protein LCH84_00490 [Gemmatimonadetes bacterium]|nr:hypothetical protein [Gemmatimonadota bacterium]